MNLESIMLSEIKSEKRQILLFNMWNLKNKANVCIYIYITKCINKLSHKYREQTSGYQWGERRRSKIGVWD